MTKIKSCAKKFHRNAFEKMAINFLYCTWWKMEHAQLS